MSFGKAPIRVVLAAHLRADPRKTAALAVLVVVMTGLCVRWVCGGDSPATAEAGMLPGAMSVAPTASTSALLPSLAARVEVKQSIARELKTDPFALDLQRFPPGRIEPKAVQAPVAVTEDPVETAARQLVLQSTVSGREPMACINGVFLRPGQRVNGFVLEQIAPTRVVLGREGIKVELYLK